jgi:hypothetical protein
MDSKSIRDSVLQEIIVLSEPSRQLAYERSRQNHVGVAHIELIEGFLDVFWPKAPESIAAFSESQLKSLAHLYGLNSFNLGATAGGTGTTDQSDLKTYLLAKQ